MYKKDNCRVCRKSYQPASGNQQRCPVCIEANKRWRGRGMKSDPNLIKEEYGDVCWICGRTLNIAKEGKAKWVRHHLQYDPEILALLCKACHGWLHALIPVYQHDFKKKFGTDLAPYIFSKRVVGLYEDYIPDIAEQARHSFPELLDYIKNAFDSLSDEEIDAIKAECEMRRDL